MTVGFRPMLLKNSISGRNRTGIEKLSLQIGARSRISSRARVKHLQEVVEHHWKEVFNRIDRQPPLVKGAIRPKAEASTCAHQRLLCGECRPIAPHCLFNGGLRPEMKAPDEGRKQSVAQVQ
ncbi:hypothetical protein [Achromobacter marplatensis]|uniref:hypothetical protein n=1 Tax=Achromobacter marplatensis TaxID=470868 RepID=UPI00117773C3|nr:hypothetical protein [Achromobacter marplatensis]